MKSFSELLLTYGLTPPKATTAAERQQEIAALQTARVNALGVDALVLYDLQDESSRTALVRPFPFIETIDPADYAADHLRGVTVPKIVYQSVSRRDVPALRRSLQAIHARGHAVVLVGAPSKEGISATKLSDAYALRSSEARELPLGGILIAERHEARGTEVDRVLTKLSQGCSFFISQAVYAVTSTKNLLSDLHYRCMRDGIAVPPVLVTLSPCGSLKTLEFMRWLGVSVPRWLENDLKHSADILETSVRVSVNLFEELWLYARDKGFSLGANIESVSLGKAEIEASVEMTKQVVEAPADWIIRSPSASRLRYCRRFEGARVGAGEPLDSEFVSVCLYGPKWRGNDYENALLSSTGSGCQWSSWRLSWM